MLNAKSIEVQLGRQSILRDVDFTAKAGQITAIVGPNGSGKTTLLRALTGDVAHGGAVTLNAVEISRAKPWELAAMRAVLPQAARLAFPFTVLEVVRLGLARGVEASAAHLPLQALARVGLSGFEGRFYHELSGGEQQRVQLARVLSQVWHPVAEDGSSRWLFLDEPVSSLDIGHQLQVMEIARDYAAAGGGVVTVLHDLNLTALYADSVAMLAGGEILAQDSPEKVLRDDLLSRAYDCRLSVNTTPASGTFILPHAAALVAE